jgi:hypothetical protein
VVPANKRITAATMAGQLAVLNVVAHDQRTHQGAIGQCCKFE